jgi:hypothetical protein
MKSRGIFAVILVIAQLCTYGGCAHDVRDALGTMPEIYKEFLDRKVPVFDKKYYHYDISSFQRVDGTVDYTLVDMTGDGEPELHLIGRICYLIITIDNNNNLMIWYSGTAYERLLNNHAILYKRNGGGPPHESYKYIEVKKNGDSSESVFARYANNPEGEYELFIIEDQEVSQSEWETFAEPYLSIGDDEIVWYTKYCGEPDDMIT